MAGLKVVGPADGPVRQHGSHPMWHYPDEPYFLSHAPFKIYVGIGFMVIAERQFDRLAGEYKLSPRQTEIVRYLLSGVLTDREIAKRMRTACGTVDKQLMRICTKMHARSRTEVLFRFVCEAKDIGP